jgi:two-component system, chemotaxis family, protein-glutamate methylesterase/glutaminase
LSLYAAGGSKPRPLRAIAIGGSAGSVDALAQLLPALRADAAVAVFVVVHLPRERTSKLVEIFSRKCELALVEAEDKQPIEPGVVYFAPPDYHLLVDAGPALALSADELVHYSRPAIDVLLESAADAYAASLLAIVLSGANEDGAAGLAAVAQRGGLTCVQDPKVSSSPTMPLAALKAAPRSAVLGLGELAELLRSIRGGHYQPLVY